MLNKFYHGFEMTLKCEFGQMKEIITFDLSRGDLIIPKEITSFYETFLEKEKIELNFFPIESVIGEKFHAILKGGIFNTRIKDFYDIYFISQKEKYTNQITTNAITNIFKRYNDEKLLNNWKDILNLQLNDKIFYTRWEKYKINNEFVPRDLSWNKVMIKIIDFFTLLFKV